MLEPAKHRVADQCVDEAGHFAEELKMPEFRRRHSDSRNLCADYFKETHAAGVLHATTKELIHLAPSWLCIVSRERFSLRGCEDAKCD